MRLLLQFFGLLLILLMQAFDLLVETFFFFEVVDLLVSQKRFELVQDLAELLLDGLVVL